ncbi:hypothetical protein VTJ83DRAFT_6406 [Remersonia thermophila]|uniref:Uncharacterized protein n=1 Tax=Remersonia thermophila TaxID=72144 RepID=A0ABR4D4L3_9PEZI
MDTASSDSCGGCYFNPAEIQQQPWDPRACIQDCRAQFLREAYSEWTETSGWKEGCASLDQGTAASELWQLYWCDRVFCGVANSQGGLGQDPNVNLIINTCQIHGFYNIFDPGPPPSDFACSTNAPPESCRPRRTPSIPAPPRETESGLIQTATASSTSYPTGTLRTFASAHSTGITNHGKAVIAICSVLALLLLLALIAVCMRRQRRRETLAGAGLRPRRGPDGGILGDNSIGPTSSPTPLITPVASSGGVRSILAPPRHRRDHQFALPSIFRRGNGRSPSPPLTPLTTADELPSDTGGEVRFPTSPVYSPTTSKLTPRYERVGGAAAIPRTYSSTSAAALERVRRYSQQPPSSSTTGGPSTGHSTLRDEVPIAAPSPVLLPLRPPRPHEEVLDLPGLLGTSSSSARLSSRVPSGGAGGGSAAAERTWVDVGDGVGARNSPRRSAPGGPRTPRLPTPLPPQSPPPTKALPRSPSAVESSASPSTTWSSPAGLRSSTWNEHAAGSTSTQRLRPPSAASGRFAVTGTTWRHPPPSTPPPPYARLPERDGPHPQEVAREQKGPLASEDAGGSVYAWTGPSAQEPAAGKYAKYEERGSWGSWSVTTGAEGLGVVVGADDSEARAGAASPRASGSSNKTPTRETNARGEWTGVRS